MQASAHTSEQSKYKARALCYKLRIEEAFRAWSRAIKTPDAQLESELFEAVQEGWVGGVRVLLSDGVDKDCVYGDGKTPLHLAVTNNNKDVAMILIDAGADLNKRDEDGKTALTAFGC